MNKLIPDVPDDVARLAALLLEKDPACRPASARALIASIARLQREKGGRSALPEAFNAFVREQTQPRVFAALTPPEKHGRRRTSNPATQAAPRFRPVGWATMAAVCMALFAASGLTYWRYARPEINVARAPVLDALTVAEPSPGIRSIQIPNPDLVLTDLAWAGDQATLVISAEGRPGSALHGGTAVFAARPEAAEVTSLLAPAAPLADPRYLSTRLDTGFIGPLPHLPKDSPLRDRFIRPVFASGAAGPDGEVFAMMHHIAEAAPSGNPVYRARSDCWNVGNGSPWATYASGQAVIKPDGYTLCLLLNDPASATNYLAERDVRWSPATRSGPRLTSPGDPILPGTFHYAPGGQFLAYARRTGPGERTLWTLDPHSGAIDGRPVAVGGLERDSAFHPHAESLAVSYRTADGPQLALIDPTDGRVLAQPGPGRVTRESWHPSGMFLVVTAPDPDTGVNQLWAVAARAPHGRVRLTQAPGGLEHGAAVSRDGKWAAATQQTAAGPAVIFAALRPGLLEN